MEPVKLNNGRCVLLNGDCLHEMRRIKSNSIDMVFADLPYGQTNHDWDVPLDLLVFWDRLHNVVKCTTPMLFTSIQPFTTALNASNLIELKDDWIWLKNRATNFIQAKQRPLRQHEHISVFYNKPPTYNPQMEDRTESSAARFKYTIARKDRESAGVLIAGYGITQYNTKRFPKSYQFFNSISNKSYHKTQKPVELLEYLIRTYTNENDTVLDPTMGSGTTGVACINLNRRFIGIEKDEHYFNVATNRIQETVTQLQCVTT